MYNKKNKEAADIMIHDFCQKFLDTFHIYPNVTYSISKQPLEKISLNMLLDLVNELLLQEISEDDPIYESVKKEGVKLLSRKRFVVLYRQTFMSIANNVGYGPTTLARFLGFDHATVIHGCRKIKDLIETKDPETIIIYTRVTNAYKIRFNNDGDVQPDSGEESDT
jgi:chromosomal replication initiation ATPase DnaA